MFGIERPSLHGLTEDDDFVNSCVVAKRPKETELVKENQRVWNMRKRKRRQKLGEMTKYGEKEATEERITRL